MEPAKLILVRGGGDIATGTIHRLHRCGFRVLVLETEAPQAIRRRVSFAEAIYEGRHTVEGVTAVHAPSHVQCDMIWDRGQIPVCIDPTVQSLQHFKPFALIDAILAKKNCGTLMSMAEITIGLGPGLSAGEDVHAVIETARGHDLGRVILDGSALPNTGIPGAVKGYTTERVLYAPHDGILTIVRDIGDLAETGEVLATIDNTPVCAPFRGIVRGMIRNQSLVRKGLKIADIDPRSPKRTNCYTISDKARCISGGVLEALLFLSTRKT